MFFRGKSIEFWMERCPSLKPEYSDNPSIDEILEIEKKIIGYQIKSFLDLEIIIEDYHNFYIEGSVIIGIKSRIASGVVIKGDSVIGKNVVLYPNVYIENSKIGDNSVVLSGSIIIDSGIKGNNRIGPYAHLRMGAIVEQDANIGNFVEMKKSIFGAGSKAMHLSYIGDSFVGKKVNIGAGTITCNYDGKNKNKTIIEDNVFIGSGTELIAPVKIEKNAYVGAGSTITTDVPENSLGIARGKQRIIKDWVIRKNKK